MKIKFHHLQKPRVTGRGYTQEHVDFQQALNLCLDRARRHGQIGYYRGPYVLEERARQAVAVTACYIYDEQTGVHVASGHAFCGPGDQFCRKTGRTIAEGRARKELAAVLQSGNGDQERRSARERDAEGSGPAREA